MVYRSPQQIPLNITDRVFLIPETSDNYGTYFPMCIILVIQLRFPVESDRIREALVRLDDRFPQYRLSYRLDLERSLWVRVADTERAVHFDRMVEQHEVKSIEAFVENSLAVNIDPITEPVRVMLGGNMICVKLFHVFGDGKFLMDLSATLLHALFKPDTFGQLPDFPDHYFLPLGRVILQNPGQARLVMSHILKRIADKIGHYLKHTTKIPVTPSAATESVDHSRVDRAPIRSGSDMKVMFSTIPSDRLGHINRLRRSLPATRKISLNTYLQVYLADRLRQHGLIDWPTTVTILADLHRYFDNPTDYYPGNYVSNIQVSVGGDDFVSAAEALQEQVEHLLDTAYPLSDIPASWLLSLGGDALFKRANREWLLKSVNTDKRFFVLTNLGELDQTFSQTADLIAPNIQLAVPLMGAPPLTVAFSTFRGQGNLAATYDPRVLSSEMVRSILSF